MKGRVKNSLERKAEFLYFFGYKFRKDSAKLLRFLYFYVKYIE